MCAAPFIAFRATSVNLRDLRSSLLVLKTAVYWVAVLRNPVDVHRRYVITLTMAAASTC
jgi:hypothetical protein